MRQPIKKLHTQQGVMLIEAMIAVMIFSMGILALVGLQGAMVKNISDNKYRVDASYIAQQRLSKMWADPNNMKAKYTETDTLLSAELANEEMLPNGKRSTTVDSRGLATVTVTWQAPGQDDVHQYVASTYIGVF